MVSKVLKYMLAIIIVLVIFSIYFLSNAFITIPAGHAGVLYRKFSEGTVVNKVFDEGFHIISPWNDMYIYDIRLQDVKESMSMLSKNGLSIKIEVSVRYFPDKENLGLLHKQIGKNYLNSVIVPELRSSTRRVIGKYDPEELYSTKRIIIQQEIFSETRATISPKFITLDAVLIRNIALPETIKTAIEMKLKQQQASKEYEFKIIKERKEAERKQIEAQGIKDFQDIVSQGISERLLKWKGIEATLELAQSQNSKIIVIGSSKDGLPIILGGAKE